MATPFRIELSVSKSPAETQARAADAFTEPADGGGTRVTINGAVARGKRPLAIDPEHWAAALGGSAV